MQVFTANGSLGGDPEMRYTPSGDAVATFSLALNNHWITKEGEKRESTIWIRVTVWRALAENCAKFLKKGSKAAIRGELAPINVYTKKDGTPGASYEVTADKVDFLDSRQQDATASTSNTTSQPAPTRETEVPF